MSEMKPDGLTLDGKRARRRAKGSTGSRRSSLFAGVFFIFLGAAWTLHNLGVFRVRDIFDFWPLLPVAWGIQAILRGKSVMTYAIGGIAVVLGALKLLDNLDIFNFGSRFYAPVILITLGFGFLARNFTGEDGVADGATVSTPLIHPYAIFSGVKRNVDSQEFEGGEAAAIFGGVDLNLRRARIKGSMATIEANAIFGGIHLRVPENWKVEVRGVAIFGGYEDKTMTPPPPADGSPLQTLILTGNAIFGGVEIEN